MDNPYITPEIDPKKITDADIAANFKPLKEGQRLPTPAEVKSMRDYAIKYRKDNPMAPKRMVERAVMRKFNITLID